MEQSKVDLFISTMNDKFPSDHLMEVRSKLEMQDDNSFPVLQSLNYKKPTTLLLFSIFLGGLGVDRFMLGQIGLGILKLVTCGGFGFWTLVDWFMISGKTKMYNLKLFMEHVN